MRPLEISDSVWGIYPDESDIKSSWAAYRAQIAFGNGARTYVATTRRGNQFEKSAHDRMTRRNPHANLPTSESYRNTGRIHEWKSNYPTSSAFWSLLWGGWEMYVLRPAMSAWLGWLTHTDLTWGETRNRHCIKFRARPYPPFRSCHPPISRSGIPARASYRTLAKEILN